MFNPLHYDNATYIFLLALHAGVEPVQLSCDTATYPLVEATPAKFSAGKSNGGLNLLREIGFVLQNLL